MTPPDRARIGVTVMRLGAVAMILGGIADQLVRELPPAHLALLGAADSHASAPGATLVLALLHTLGYALIAAGMATLALLRQRALRGDPKVAVQAAAVAVLAEGANALHMHQLGLGLYVIPLAITAVVLTGLLICVVPTWAFSTLLTAGR
jgi:hypothetical protein